MRPRVPLAAVLLGAAGLIPFLAAALASLSADPGERTRMLMALTGYGATILAFLGGIHWGFALSPAPGGIGGEGEEIRPKGQTRWLALALLPSLIGWAAILVTIYLPIWSGLIVLIGGFVFTTLTEYRASRHPASGRDPFPPGFLWMRLALSLAVILILAGVLPFHMLRLNP